MWTKGSLSTRVVPVPAFKYNESDSGFKSISPRPTILLVRFVFGRCTFFPNVNKNGDSDLSFEKWRWALALRPFTKPKHKQLAPRRLSNKNNTNKQETSCSRSPRCKSTRCLSSPDPWPWDKWTRRQHMGLGGFSLAIMKIATMRAMAMWNAALSRQVECY